MRKPNRNNKIDVIIPAYKAQKTILRTVASIAEQTIKDDVEVIIVNDACPNGDYSEVINMYKPYLSIKEIKLDVNGGPGVARQAGIDATSNEFFTCIDADDTFVGSLALEILRTGIKENEIFKCVSGTFMQLGDTLQHMVPHQNDMVWMFGKMYRREFIDQYKIRFNTTRANEDTGFNTWVRLICSNQGEQVRYIPEVVYYWHNKTDSITRINDGQYQYDQCLTGWTDNMISVIQNVRKIRPFDGAVTQWMVGCMFRLYYYYIEVLAKKPVFADQAWEYVKKYYHSCYKKVEEDISEEVFGQMYAQASHDSWNSYGLMGVVPSIGIREFMDKLHTDPYDPNHIYEVWEAIPEELKENNIKCGVCEKDYYKRTSEEEPIINEEDVEE